MSEGVDQLVAHPKKVLMIHCTRVLLCSARELPRRRSSEDSYKSDLTMKYMLTLLTVLLLVLQAAEPITAQAR